ncbi:MAG TPA: right-handed parallel beta-helix repeat-containing protein [Mycobacteriales bacterium]|nr:right-handed parallel beta-helix repeat-containing protein [Mycobacteriales bacterium]
MRRPSPRTGRHASGSAPARPSRPFRLRRTRSTMVALALAGGTLATATVGVLLAGPGGAGAAPAPVSAENAAKQAALVAAEDRRLTEIRSVTAVAPLRGGVSWSKPYRLTTGAGYTLVLTQRSAPYTVKDLLTLAPQTFVRQKDGSYLLLENIYLNLGAKLALTNPGGLTVRMASSSSGFVSIVSFGGELSLLGTEQARMKLVSWDPRTNTPDTDPNDGRAYIRAIGGQFRMGYVDVSDLGFWSGRTGGISLTGTDRPNTGSTSGPDDQVHGKTARDKAKAATSGPAQPSATPEAGDVYAQPSGELTTPDTRFGVADQSYVSAQIGKSTIRGDAYGLFVSSADGIEVRDTVVAGSLVDGVILHRFASNAVVERVTSQGNAGDGFVLARAAQEVRISGAKAIGNGGNGFSVSGRALAEGPSPSGETVGDYGHNSIANSLAQDNARYGIEIDGGSDVGLQNNQVRGGDMGIVVRRGAEQVSVVGNQVSGQARQGISVRDGVVRATVTGNTVESTPMGIYLRDSVGTIRGNTVDRVTNHGVTLVGSVKGTQVAYNTISGTGPTALDAARSHGKVTIERNQTGAWHDTRSFWIRLRHAAKPMTLLWLGVVLLVLVSAVRARKLGARGVIRHPYEKQQLLDTSDKGELLRSIAAAESIREPVPAGGFPAPLPVGGRGAPAPDRWDPTGVDQPTQMLRRPAQPVPSVASRPAVQPVPSRPAAQPVPSRPAAQPVASRTAAPPVAPRTAVPSVASRPAAPPGPARTPVPQRAAARPVHSSAPNLVIGRPAHPSDPRGVPAYQEDATTVLPRPRRSAEDPDRRPAEDPSRRPAEDPSRRPADGPAWQPEGRR